MATHANSTAAPSRRGVFALAAAPLALSGTFDAQASADAVRFDNWKTEAAKAEARANRRGAGDDEVVEWNNRAAEFEGLIIGTPTRSHAAMLIKLETIGRIAMQNGDTEYAETFAQAAAFIRGEGAKC